MSTIVTYKTKFIFERGGDSIDFTPICNDGVESGNHVFFSCSVTKAVIHRILKWWGLEEHDFNSTIDWSDWFGNTRMWKNLKDVMEGMFFVAWWFLWMFRNRVVFL